METGTKRDFANMLNEHRGNKLEKKKTESDWSPWSEMAAKSGAAVSDREKARLAGDHLKKMSGAAVSDREIERYMKNSGKGK